MTIFVTVLHVLHALTRFIVLSAPLTINVQQVQQLVLLILTPPLMSVVGLYLAALLRQDHFPALWNAVIAWAAILLMACASAWAHNQLVGSSGINGVLTAVSGVATLLIAGPLSQLRGFLQLDWIQSHLFSLSEPQVQALLGMMTATASTSFTPAPASTPQAALPASTAQAPAAASPFHDHSPVTPPNNAPQQP